ncbi:hypothetical protein E4695_13040 [Alcaligenaceae bacterium 429]|nr:hypothetical protein E4695_13040 [Alcaligenaceae bacterium 429]
MSDGVAAYYIFSIIKGASFMPEWLQQAISSFVGAGMGTTAVGWYIKTRIEAGVRERHMRLEADLQSQLEESKSKLARFAVEHQVKFSHLHTQRAEVVAQGYMVLRHLYDATRSYTSPAGEIEGNAREHLRIAVLQALEAAEDYLLPRLIYLPEKSAENTKSFLSLMNRNAGKFRVTVDTSADIPKIAAWQAVWNEVSKDGEQLLNELANDYREVLDVC